LKIHILPIRLTRREINHFRGFTYEQAPFRVTNLALAYQAVEPAQGALSKIADQGVLGAICVLLITAVGWTLRGWLREKDDRRVDQKSMGEAVKDVSDGAKDMTIEMKGFMSNMVVETSKSNESVRSALTGFEREHIELRRSVDDLRNEQVRLAAALQR
jgi:hypothetical protein